MSTLFAPRVKARKPNVTITSQHQTPRRLCRVGQKMTQLVFVRTSSFFPQIW